MGKMVIVYNGMSVSTVGRVDEEFAKTIRGYELLINLASENRNLDDFYFFVKARDNYLERYLKENEGKLRKIS